jgi:hypothetical protein
VENGYFRYRLNVKHSRILPGKYSFLAQVKNNTHIERMISVVNIHFIQGKSL